MTGESTVKSHYHLALKSFPSITYFTTNLTRFYRFRKHFPYEDYDEWLFGEQGLWQWNASASNFPHVLVIHVGLHTCIHANNAHPTNESVILQHERDIATMMVAVHKAVHRTPSEHHRTEVIILLPGRAGNSDAKLDRCSREFNRLLAHEAH